MKNISIKQKLTFSYIVIIIVTVLVIGIIISVIFSSQLVDSSNNLLDLRISKISKEIEDQLLSVIKITEEVSGNQDILHAMNSQEMYGSRESIRGLREILTPTERRSPMIERIILINHNLEILDPVYSRSLYSRAILSDDDFSEFLSRKYFFYFSKPGTFPIDGNESGRADNLTITLYQRLLDDNYWLMGYLVAVLNQRMLFSSIWNSNRDKLFSGIYIFNERNELLFGNGEKLPPFEIRRNLDFSTLKGNISYTAEVDSQKSLILVKLIPSVNWFVTGIISYDSIFRNLNIALKLITLIGFVFTLFTSVISFLIARTITKPILQITSVMHDYEKSGNLKTIDLKASGELKYMGEVYNKLVSQINSFIENIYREQEEKHAAELKSVKYELEFLQAQINPHFIHNTLNAIGYQAEKEGNTVVYESLRSFNILLRAAISGIEDKTTLKQECMLIDNFIKIQRLRYGNTFKVVYDIPPSLEDVRVPKLILQPLVENAVFHGIEPGDTDGEIIISAKETGGFIVLEVSDNGTGFEYKDIENRRKFNKIGLSNVDERIKILYGHKFGLSVFGKPGEGTTISILLPSVHRGM